MGLVVLRGAIRGESAGNVAIEAIIAMAIFALVGAAAGWISDRLVRDAVEQAFRSRVEWYRKVLEDAGHAEQESSDDS